MSDKIDVVPSALSGGEQQKVAIARAIINDPLVLAADEPAGNLDRDSAYEVFRIFEKINQTGTTVVIATHNDEIVQRMHKRVITLKEAVRDDAV
jgi:cell division transport system ATP-binding protein